MYGVTGATGKLGRLAIDALLERVPAAEVVAVVRSPAKASDLAARGVQVRRGDYTEPASLDAALAGVQQLLFISGSEVGQRIPQHRAVIDAAKARGIERVVYTSILHAETSRLALAREHKATEDGIVAAGLSHTFLRNGWYTENYTANLAPVLAHGAVLGAAEGGRISAAPRSDYAEAAAIVLSGSGHDGKAYELAGDTSFTKAEFAAAVAAWSGKTVGYVNLSQADYAQALIGVGLPAVFAEMLADSDVGIARGELEDSSHDLSRLLGRPTKTLREVLAELPRPA